MSNNFKINQTDINVLANDFDHDGDAGCCYQHRHTQEPIFVVDQKAAHSAPACDHRWNLSLPGVVHYGAMVKVLVQTPATSAMADPQEEVVSPSVWT